MVIDNNRMNIFLVPSLGLLSITIQTYFLALYVISNILPYLAQQSVSFLNPATLGEIWQCQWNNLPLAAKQCRSKEF